MATAIDNQPSLKELSDSDLQKEIQATEFEYQQLLFTHAVKGLPNPLVIRDTRRDIARIKTEVRRREMTTMTEAQLASRSKIRARRSKR
jgi:large subunit ribosomal protein L29